MSESQIVRETTVYGLPVVTLNGSLTYKEIRLGTLVTYRNNRHYLNPERSNIVGLPLSEALSHPYTKLYKESLSGVSLKELERYYTTSDNIFDSSPYLVPTSLCVVPTFY